MIIDPLLLAAIAIVVNAYLGDPLRPRRGLWHPAVALGRVADWLAARLNVARRSDRDRRLRGGLSAWVLLLLAVLAGLALAALSRALPLFWVFEVALVIGLIEVRQAHDRIDRVADGLAEKGVTGGRAMLPAISTREAALADVHEIARIGVEAAGRRLVGGVVGPVLFYALFGLAGLLGYGATVVLADRWARPDPAFAAFGSAAGRLARIARWPADWAAALALSLAAASTDNATPRGAFAVLGKMPPGWKQPPVAALAGALGLALIGPRRYAAGLVDRPWIGDGRSAATATDIRQALALYRRAIIVVMAPLVVIAAARLAS